MSSPSPPRESKREDAHDLGADEVVISRKDEEMEKHANSFDFILNTVAAEPRSRRLHQPAQARRHPVPGRRAGAPHPSPNVGNLIFKRRAIAGSLIGGIAETQEMLDFCAEHGIVADIEMIPHPADRRGLRPHAEQRRQIPLRDRQLDARGLSGAS